MPDTEVEPRTRLDRRTFLGVTAGLLASAGLWWAIRSTVRETHALEVTYHVAMLPGLTRPLRVVQWTDLHFGPWVHLNHVQTWIDATTMASPDLIVLTGDLVDRHEGPEAADRLAKELKTLHAPLGVYAVWGNHDHAHFGDLTRFERKLGEAGVQVLVNQGRTVRKDLHLMGIDDLLNGRPNLEATFKDRPKNVATLLLSHNPDALPRIPKHEASVTLCGHTHGGQVVLPVVGPPFTSSRYGRKYLSGWVTAPARGYVSRGLGVSYAPVRWNCPAELAVFDFMPEPA